MTVEREPGTIIRDRYVLTAPFGEPAEAVAWRAVDMVLRRRVVVVFDPARDEDSEPGGPIPFDTEPPADVPVGDVLDGGHHADGFYRVFRTATDTSPLPDADTDAADAEPADEARMMVPLFGTIDGADATRPIHEPAGAGGYQPPPLDAVPLPVDPTIELPTPGDQRPWGPLVPDSSAVPPAVAEALDRSRPGGGHRPRTGPHRPGPIRHPLPLSVTAVTVAGVLGLSAFLLARPPTSVSTTIGPPPAAADASPATTAPTTVVEETTTTETTVPETTTLPPVTYPRRAPVTAPPETAPPETAPPETAPPLTRRTTTTRSTTTKPTTTTLQQQVNRLGAADGPLNGPAA
jgi:hypothetical protein